MLKLCTKDYLACRWLWLSVAALFILYIIQPLGQTMVVMMLGALAVYAALSVTLIFEDQGKTETLYASLPLERRTIVRGRYLLAGLIVLAGAAVIFGSAALTLALFKATAYEEALLPLLSFEGVVGYIFVAGLLLAVFLPLYYRFGLGRGNAVYLGVLFGLLLALAGLDRFASRTLHIMAPLLTADFLKDPGRGTVGLLGLAKEGFGPLLFVGVFLSLSVLLVLISLQLSTRFYDNKEF
jgi:ABC-2 type transport system permease protein